MKILIAGMKHSGSTMLLNGLKYWIEYKKISDINIAKRHSFSISDGEYFDKIFITSRDVRDVSISHFHRFIGLDTYKKCSIKEMKEKIMLHGIYLFINSMYENISLYYSWQNKGIPVYYEKMMADKKKEWKKILNDLSLPYTDEEIDKLVTYLNNSFDNVKYKNLDEYQENETTANKKIGENMLTASHNTSGGKTEKYKEFFSKTQLKLIHSEELIDNFVKTYDKILSSFEVI